jgi:antitoxin HicB
MRSYTIVLYKEPEGGYSVVVPALKGCATQGETIAEAKRMAKEAIELYLECLVAHDRPVPTDVKSFRMELGESAQAQAYRVAVQEPVHGPGVAKIA